MDIETQVRALMYGADFGDPQLGRNMERELRDRLHKAKQENRPLRVYAGYDPSGPDIHLGHTITLRKLRLFQEFGHEVTFLIGTFTAQVGDTSDKTSGRPRKTREEVLAAAQTYAEQCFKILDRDRIQVKHNGDWLEKMTLADVISLSSHFTVQQFLTRDNYKKRLESGNPVGLHEFLYALLQGYDAVHLRCDVQLGATDQLFNIMAGRKLQEAHGQLPCICLTYPILVGTDGKMRMSKSAGNYIGIAEPPEEQFGKTMRLSDPTMLDFMRLVTRWTPDQIEAYRQQVTGGQLHPMEMKKILAREIVAMYHGDAAAESAKAHFEHVHQQQNLPESMPGLTVPAATNLIDFLATNNLIPSKSQARRLMDGGGLKMDGEPIRDYNATLDRSCILQVGKRGFYQIQVDG
ncbi:MAG: tyrosine--tRNA ligase [Magnetococcales bacterium]|nr:tyrosine--tRNA ligase [Magnetococcales bacterium]MBF0322090.1 tyrosine--tRNA ligase [Magnetococcales bacterium]